VPEIPCESGKHGRCGFIHPGRACVTVSVPSKRSVEFTINVVKHSLIEDEAEL